MEERAFPSLFTIRCNKCTCSIAFPPPHRTGVYIRPAGESNLCAAPLVLGGQQLLWTKQSGPQNLDSIVWLRAAAFTEVFWTGPGGNDSAALRWLHELGYRFRQRGVCAIPLQPKWCALRPFACDLTA
ncbi:hypothetical protein BJV78DRAFT_1127930 [Lactifluus subvellereus]|nr:hypothetical protein BJV78DRAFT_1127930 [Lactifluus subvellereus]